MRNKQQVDIHYHLMIDFETRNALAFITYIDAYELHWGDENFFNDFINE